MKNGSVIAFSSNFDPKRLEDWKHAFTKPLHYGIQGVTGSKFHHVGMYCDGYFYEAMAKFGVRKIKFEQKLSEIAPCVDTYIFPPSKKLLKAQVRAMIIDLDNQVGKKYSALEAFLSILTAILCVDSDQIKTKEQFCSKLAFLSYRNLFPSKLNHILPRTLNPEELLKVLKRFKLIKENAEVIVGRP